MPELGAVVLASGESARFGDSDKLLAPFHGKPLLAHALMALPGDVFIRRLVVTRGAEAAALAKSLGFDVLLHDKPDVSDTIRLGIARMRGLDGCLFCVGDQPLLRADTVRRLAAAFAAEPARIVRAAFDGRGGNPVLFPQALFGELRPLRRASPRRGHPRPPRAGASRSGAIRAGAGGRRYANGFGTARTILIV